MKIVALTMEEQKRVEVIQRVFRGELTMGEAAMVLGVCERHSYYPAIWTWRVGLIRRLAMG